MQGVFILLLIVSTTAVPCPDGCSCGNQMIACRNLPSTQIPRLPMYVGHGPGEAVLSVSIFHSPTLTTIQANAFDNLEDLTSLHLYNNRITNVSSLAFNNLKRLGALSMRQNEFVRLPDDLFDTVPNLFDLDLSYNKLTRLPISIERLSKIKVLRLNNIPIDCSCDIVDFAINLADIENSYAPAICATPAEMRGKKLSMLGSMTKSALNSTRQLGYYPSGSDPEYFYRNLIGKWPWEHCPVGDIGGIIPIDYKSASKEQTAPVIIHAPESVYAVVGDEVEFQCEVKGFPQPQISWILPSERTEYIKTLGRRRILKVMEVHDYYEGTFTCVAKNDLGMQMRSATLRLIPQSRPRIVSSPPAEDNSVMPGEDLMLKCIARGRPKPKLSWIWQQISLPRKLSTSGAFIVRTSDAEFVDPKIPIPDDFMESSSRRQQDMGLTHAYEEECSITLIIRNITDQLTAGSYVCYAASRAGIAKISTIIRLKEVKSQVIL
ncbi:hypothetical protein Ciccas_008367 [Cichlidogyrus casuarinus]|uniref:Ig-like domain-containing protein n=1 Tax=Cichlidogyrus casuarinus TaxID=1844966 RepID=A0ABD2Q060_9PLAT